MTLFATLRHGPTAWNAEKRLQGRADIPLDPGAEASLRALRLPPIVAGWPVLTSPLSRCRQTAAALGLEATVEPALVEMDWGDYEGRRLADLRQDAGGAFAAAEARGLDFQPPGGESPRQVLARLAPLLARIAAAGQPRVAITHRGVIRVLHAVARGWDMVGKPPEKLAVHGTLQIFRLAPDGSPAIMALDVALVGRDCDERQPADPI